MSTTSVALGSPLTNLLGNLLVTGRGVERSHGYERTNKWRLLFLYDDIYPRCSLAFACKGVWNAVGGDTGCRLHQKPGSWCDFFVQANQDFHPSEVGGLEPDLFGKDKTLIFFISWPPQIIDVMG